ncbi:MAG: type I-B CRISPR-associated protein Cas5b [Methanobrevibacter sp.]|nr:type I-B CRISPR-associated protein Cas5b [Methanobrevibacter sp.]
MDFLRITIEGWVSSFRYPAFISGYQPTLPLPPLSTIYGLISAVKGEYVTPEDINVGFIFFHDGRGVDLETIYELTNKPSLSAKSNVVRREFLFNPKLYLYLDNLNYEHCFKNPEYPLLLGRSSDIMSISNIDKISMDKKNNVKLGKTILPMGVKGAHGTIQALATHFTNNIPREALGVKPFVLTNSFFNYNEDCFYDSEMDWGVWIHK